MRYRVKKAVDVLKLACKVDKPYAPRVIALDKGILVKGQSVEALVPFELNTDRQLGFTQQVLEKLAYNNDLTEEQFLKAGTEIDGEHLIWEPNYTTTVDAQKFKKALDVVRVGASKEDARPILKGVLVDDNKLVAIDGYRILTRELECSVGFRQVIPPQAVEFLSKFITKSTKELDIFANDEVIGFRLDDLEIRVKPLQGEYLNYAQVLNSDNELLVKVNRKDLLGMVNDLIKVPYYDDKGKKLSDKPLISKRRPLKITFEESLLSDDLDMTLSLHDDADIPDRGLWVDVLHGTDKVYKDFTIAFNPWYVAEALKVAYEDEEVEIQFTSNLCPMIITGSNSKCLVLPIRIK